MKIFIIIGFCYLFVSTIVLAQEKHLLIIGDSHTEGTFGNTLDQQFRSDGRFWVHTIGVGGSTPSHWLEGRSERWGYFERQEDGVELRSMCPQTPKLTDLLKKERDLIIIALGTNFLWDIPQETITQTTRELANLPSSLNVRCFWIGPPRLGSQYQHRINAIKNIMANSLQNSTCYWLDSFPLSEYPWWFTSDDIHYDSAGPRGREKAQEWARQIYQQIRSILEKETPLFFRKSPW